MELEIKNKGFTLIEMLVAMAVFSIVILTMTSVSFSAIRMQRNAFAMQESQEAGRYILEMISKEIRMSIVISGSGARDSLNIINSSGENIVYEFDNGTITKNDQLLNPNNIEVSGKFHITNQTNPVISKVTIVMNLKSTRIQTGSDVEINLQSSIVARPY
ncbi:MAG: prepilin-type N-terminal cleavage/methylation domain-containing protein [bacterium]